jgi:hypothetical protein
MAAGGNTEGAIEHISGNTHCAVSKKLDDYNPTLNHVAVANQFDTICGLSWCILCVCKVTFLIYFYPTILLHTVLDVGYCRYLLTLNP